MLFSETLRVAIQSIRANLFRAILTMLGIVIGVAAVITMTAAGSGAQKAVEEQIDFPGTLRVIHGLFRPTIIKFDGVWYLRSRIGVEVNVVFED